MKRRSTIGLGAALVAPVSTWGGAGRLAVDAPLIEQCGDVPADTSRVAVETSDGTRLGAARLGSAGEVGLVIAY